jgi:hypothetical protein
VALIADLLSRVRLELGDNAAQFTTKLTGDGVTKDFYVKYKPIDSFGLYGFAVYVNGTAKAQGTDYTVEEALGMIHFVTAPASSAAIVVTGTHYRYFSTNELTTFVNTAVLQHTDNKTDSYGRNITIASIPPIEEYPVALLATTEALWALATDAAFDINISAPDGVTIPRSQRFSQLSQIIASRKEQYRELCAALNIGLWRIEMGVLRRVSRTTNRLVPVYMAQEIDDSTKPERVYIENNLKGRTPLPNPIGVYDIVITQGDTWSVEFDIYNTSGTAFNLTGYNLQAQIRTYPGSPLLVASPTITVVDMVNGKITLSLTSDQTDSFPLKSFWDLQISSVDGTFNQTYVRGLVFANPQVTVDNPTPVVYQPYQGPTFTADNPTKTATVGTPYNYTFTASGTSPTYVVSSGSLPTGLNLSTDGLGIHAGHPAGSIYGTPTVAGTFVFAVTCTSSYVSSGTTYYMSTSTPNFSIKVS